MGKSTTITHFFNKKNHNDLESNASDTTLPTTNADIPIPRNGEIPIPENVDIHISKNVDIPISDNLQPKFQKIDTSLLERDIGLHQQIWDYHVNQCDEIWQAYINHGAFEPNLTTYKKSKP